MKLEVFRKGSDLSNTDDAGASEQDTRESGCWALHVALVAGLQ